MLLEVSGKMNFFKKNKSTVQIEWNAANVSDWCRVKMIFVNAYVGAYKYCDVNALGLEDALIRDAKDKSKDPLQLYFEHEFDNEFSRINNQLSHQFKINYMILKFHGQPIAFIASQLNYKSGRVYIRWNTVSPGFQQLGLGRLMLDEVKKYYKNDKIELYTRILNQGARNFYKRYGMFETSNFYFDEPNGVNDNISRYAKNWLCDSKFKESIYPPVDEKVSQLSAFVGYCKP